jgi:hypothetical protein
MAPGVSSVVTPADGGPAANARPWFRTVRAKCHVRLVTTYSCRGPVTLY